MPVRTSQICNSSTIRRCAIAALVIAAVACNRSNGQEATPQGGGGGGRGGRGGGGGLPVPVEVAVAELGTAARLIAATGTVEPIRSIGINAQVGGALLRVAVEEGDVVAAGQMLAEIDSRELEAQLASAEASLEVAKRVAERSQQLRDQQINTVAEYERDQAAFTAARASRDQLRTRVGFATVRSPLAGVVLDKRIEQGDIVTGQTRLFTIGDVSTLVVRVPVSELDVGGLKQGDHVPLTLDAFPGRTLAARVRRVFPSADTLTRLIPVEIALTPEAARGVKPGYLARVNIQLDPRTNVLMVPTQALLEDPSGAVVYLARGGKAVRTRVRRGGTFQGRVEVVEGLAPGDSVIVAGNNMVRDGGAIRLASSPILDSTMSDGSPSPQAAAANRPGGSPR
jgi:RND family efflux transporter MFP subunit